MGYIHNKVLGWKLLQPDRKKMGVVIILANKKLLLQFI